MAQRVQVILEDDLDQSPADETVTFGLDGVSYEIDLSAQHAEQLRTDLAGWIGHARRAGGARRSPAARPRGGPRRKDLTEVRKWARAKGYEVSDRGRISAEVQEAYDAAH